MTRDYYAAIRDKYLPNDLKYIFVLESPPASGKYFYDLSGKISEPLFKAMMKLIQIIPKTKKEGLLFFQKTGHFLVDATYMPVNEYKGKTRDDMILKDYEMLCRELKGLCRESSPDIILVKANICRLLEPKLTSDGFNIKNNGVVVPFPSTGQQKNFKREIKRLYP